jgi:hypothetical protein
MGFNWDKYDTGGGDFISAAEKRALAEQGVPFSILNVVERESRFEHDSEFVIKIVVPEGVEGVEPGERALTFAKGTGAESRDRTLEGMMEHFGEDGADEIEAKLAKVGRAWLIKAA